MGGTDFGEANKYLFIFTKDFGLIKASAQSLRQLKSKLRYSAQDFSRADLSLVRGKNIWRITNAAYKQNFYNALSADKRKLTVAIHILILLKRLLPNEGRNEALYEIVAQALFFLEKERFLADDADNFENIILIKILHNLGYFDGQGKIDGREVYKSFLESSVWKKNLLNEMDKIKKEAVRDINNALNATHLF